MMIGISIQIQIQEATAGKSVLPALISGGCLMLQMLVYIKARKRVDWMLAFVAASFNLELSDKYGCIFITVMTSKNRQDKVLLHRNRLLSSPFQARTDAREAQKQLS